MVRPPFSRRRSDDDIVDFFVLREGVPDGLVSTMVSFALRLFYGQDEILGRTFPIRDTIDAFARVTDRYLPQFPDDAAKMFAENRALLLDAVDFVLGRMNVGRDAGLEAGILELALREARSAYTVGEDGSGRLELQHRQPEAVTALIAEATSTSDRAGEHLRRAWSKAFARNPDPNGACVEAVAAIEIAAKPVVSPNNAKATLGTIIRDMKANPSKWESDSAADDGIADVIAMMDMVWTGHFRHGDELKPIAVSNQGAEMAVQLAALLVHWFGSRRVRRGEP